MIGWTYPPAKVPRRTRGGQVGQDEAATAKNGFVRFMNYQDAIEYLYSVRLFGTKLGLANTRHLMRQLGHPDPPANVQEVRRAGDTFLTVHVAGTNGKGSVCAMVSSILSAAGYTVGMFTSPHILSFRERIRIGKALITQEDVCGHLQKLLPIIEEMAANPPAKVQEVRRAGPARGHRTFFEIVTALAVDYFAERNVDVVVAETGMGGRLDATNVLPSKIEVITAIGLEHTAYLGTSIPEIASEKAAIIKEGATVIVGERDERAAEVIRRKAAEKKARLVRLGEDIAFANRELKFPAQQLTIVTKTGTYPDILLPLLGEHQAANCCLAVAAAEELRRHGLAISPDKIYEGIRETRWPGRFEVIPGRPRYVLDAACNPHACEALVKTVSEVIGEAELTLVVGFLRDKDYRRMCEILFPMATNIVLTEPKSQRALPVEELREVAASVAPEKEVRSFGTVEGAISYASSLCTSAESFVCVTGSNYMLGPARKALGLDDLPDDFFLSESFDSGKKRAAGGP
jgi:dihydrofolate synthase/folylpolyglutamate synthase